MLKLCGVSPTEQEEDEVDASHFPDVPLEFSIYDTQSGTSRFNVSVNTPERQTEEQIVTFSDQNPAYTYDVVSQPDPTFSVVSTNDDTLDNFFNRPLKIAEYEWPVNNILFETFNPWSLFFANPRVINRITNFNLMRCKLHVKIVLNGNGFYFGSAIASYLPLHTNDEFTVNRSLFTQDIIACSQRPHIYLNPTASQGGGMTLPFVWNKNALSIPDQDWTEMGEMNIRHINLLQHANGATESVTISVFAWATDMSLDIPTSTDPGGIVPQAGMEKGSSGGDEYGTGPVSKPASIIAKAAGSLSMAPGIGIYAKATSIAASAIASVARVFGYSRPAIIEDVCPYKPTYMGNLANTNAGDTCQRLALDAKQEVTIDPRTVGLGNIDEMAITSLAMRESFVTTFSWITTQSPETKLWNSYVSPRMWDLLPAGELPEVHMTPSCWVSMPFKYWRGSMKFRFQVVASNYHKGRLKIVYDPYYQTTNEYNTNYTYIIDIAEEKDFTVTVGWGQTQAYATGFSPGVDPVPFTTGVLGGPQAEANGMLSVYIVNDLTTPSALPESISINVFTSMCDDFELGNPTQQELDNFVFSNEPAPVAAPLFDGPGPVERSDAPREWPLGMLDLQRRHDLAVIAEEAGKKEDALERIEEFVSKAPLDDYLFEAFAPQSGTESGIADVDNTDNYAAPMTMESDVTLGNNELSQTDHTTDVYLGEAVVSIRQILKRYMLHTTFGPSIFGPIVYKRNQNDLPYYRGAVPGAIHASTINGQFTPYNRCKVTLLNWYVPAFVAWRGATRWKYQVSPHIVSAGGVGIKNATTDAHLEVTRWATEPYGYRESHLTFAENGTDASVFVATNLPTKVNSLNGVTRSQLSQNPVIECELPWYSNRRFFFGKKKDLTTNSDDDHYHEFQTISDLNAAEEESIMFDDFCSIGEDFSLFFFTGAPIVYYRGPTDPPV